MLKKILAGVLTAMLFIAPALAEAYSGTTVAVDTLRVFSEANAAIEALNAHVGARVSEGDVLARLRTTKVFASQNGTIARIEAHADETISGTVLELRPVSRYTIHCTSDGAYDAIENGVIHSGESLYVRCTANGTHRGTATITSIDGNTYMAEATGGEFYVGETVYLYRDEEFSSEQRVGIGTVVVSDTEIYEAEGKLVELHVKAGEYVEKGELLYEIIDGKESQISAPLSGIVTLCNVSAGDSVKDGQELLSIVSAENICVEIQVDESAAARLKPGDQAAITCAADADERLIPGTITEIMQISNGDGYTVRIAPETPIEYLGMTVTVRIG